MGVGLRARSDGPGWAGQAGVVDMRRISILYQLDLEGPAGLCPPGPTYARAQSTLVTDTSSGMHARIPRWDPGMRIPVQVCAYLSIPGLGSPDWVTLDSVTSNSGVLGYELTDS